MRFRRIHVAIHWNNKNESYHLTWAIITPAMLCSILGFEKTLNRKSTALIYVIAYDNVSEMLLPIDLKVKCEYTKFGC